MQNPSIKLSHSPKKTNPSPDAKPNKKNILHVYVLSNKCGITCMYGFLQLVKLSRARFILEKSKQKKESNTSSSVGAFTRTFKQRDRIASVTFEELLQHKIRRQEALYFSIVLRRECWASLESLSTSLSTNTNIP